MDPSSLIFVVIIGIWAVYLLQHWVRRREQLATSRSVDRFSEAMRVLERRAPIPVPLPPSQNRPHVVAPTAARAQPEKRTPEVAMTQQARRTRGRTHRLRALILLALMIGTPACWAAHIWGTLLLWPAAVVTAVMVLDLMFVRSVVRRAATRKRMAVRRTTAASRGVRSGRTADRTSRRPMPRQQAKPFPAPLRRTTTSAPSTTTAQRPASQSARPSGAAVMTEERVAVHSPDAITEVIMLEGGWEPVAVPPPTYTMKAKAERPAETAARLEPDSDSAPSREPLQPAVAIDDIDLDAVLDRRRAAGE